MTWRRRRSALYNNRDENEPEIIAALEAVGARCEQWDVVDLVVGFRRRTYLLEVKNPGRPGKKGKRQAATDDRQRLFRARWPGHYEQVETPEEALRAIGANTR